MGTDLQTNERVLKFLDCACHNHDIGAPLRKLAGDSLAHPLRATSDDRSLKMWSANWVRAGWFDTYPSLNGKLISKEAIHFGESV